MPLVMNTSNQEQQVKVHGSWFSFAPKKIRNMDPDKVFHLVSKCSYLGFVAVPDEFEDPEYKATPEGKKTLAEIEARGLEARISHLESLIENERQSLRKDMDQKNMKSDVSAEMSPSSLSKLEQAAKELAGYRKQAKSEDIEKAERLKALDALLKE